jgi:alpha-galactosidase
MSSHFGKLASLGLLALVSGSYALDNGLALTPPMGWNSYNFYGGNVTESQVLATAKAFVSTGLKAAGYKYVVIDYCWANMSRDANGNMVPSATKFPHGMKYIGDSLHALGLKFGMYASPTKVTCCGSEAGSYNHEATDAKNFAAWGVDYLKYDWCGVQSGETSVTDSDVISRYVAMRNALKATGRPIVFALCEKGQGAKKAGGPWTWSDTVGNMWRITGDIAATWARFYAQVDVDAPIAKYAGPGGWNDPDMLEVGNDYLANAPNENQVHFSLWCMLSAPLLMGNNVSSMKSWVHDILVNQEAIAIDQDSLGKQATRLKTTNGIELWGRDLANGDKAVLVVNRSGTPKATFTVNWTDLGLSATKKLNVRNIWNGATTTGVTTSTTVVVDTLSCAFLRLHDASTPDALAAKEGPSEVRQQGRALSFVPKASGPGEVDFLSPSGVRIATTFVQWTAGMARTVEPPVGTMGLVIARVVFPSGDTRSQRILLP